MPHRTQQLIVSLLSSCGHGSAAPAPSLFMPQAQQQAPQHASFNSAQAAAIPSAIPGKPAAASDAHALAQATNPAMNNAFLQGTVATAQYSQLHAALMAQASTGQPFSALYNSIAPVRSETPALNNSTLNNTLAAALAAPATPARAAPKAVQVPARPALSAGEPSEHTQQLLQQMSPASAPSMLLQPADISLAFQSAAQTGAELARTLAVSTTGDAEAAASGGAAAAAAATSPGAHSAMAVAAAAASPSKADDGSEVCAADESRWPERLCHSTFFGQCARHGSTKHRRCEVRARMLAFNRRMWQSCVSLFHAHVT